MKSEKSKGNYESLIYIKTQYFTMIKCLSIFLVFILTGVLIWFIVSMHHNPGLGHGHAIKDYSSSVCWNFNFTLSQTTYRPSDIIKLSGSCDKANDTEVFCPFWEISNAYAEYHVLQDKSIQSGGGCIRTMKIQVINFNTLRKRVHLLVRFNYPKSEPVQEVNIERSDDGEVCRQNRDCHFADQFCSPSGSCSCHERWVFLRNAGKCIPAIYKAKEPCQVTAQCQIPKSTCQNGSCECVRYYTPDLNHTQCVLEEIYKVSDRCLYTSQCKIPNSICHNGQCECSKHYKPNLNSTQCILQDVYKIKEQCLFTSQCKISNSLCDNGKCECSMHFKPNFNLTECILEELYKIKEPCLLTSQCKISKSFCGNGKCECSSYYTPNFDLTRCVPEEIFKIQEPCLFTSQCKISNSFCGDGKCECSMSYTPNVDLTQCIPDEIYTIKEPCHLSSQCKIDNSVCGDGKCECNSFYTPNSDLTKCVPEGKYCGQPCLVDENCQMTNTNSVCRLNRCDCEDRYPPSYDRRKNNSPKSAATSKFGAGWTFVLLLIFPLYIS